MIAVGGLVIRDGLVLVAKPSIKKGIGMWRIPGGIAEATETLERSVVRHVAEETGVECEPFSIAGMRYAVRECRCAERDEMYIVFSSKYLSGDPVPVRKGIVEADFMAIEEVLTRDDVVQLTAEIVRAWHEDGGLVLAEKAIPPVRRWNIYEFYTMGEASGNRNEEALEVTGRVQEAVR